jgi:predicted membrane-bound spermidine synthase
MRAQKWLLNGLVFVAGMTTLAVEMAAARLLAPWFGDSLPIWASLIGLILVYLSAGYWLGGRLADRSPTLATLCRLCAWAGFLIGLVPAISRPVLRLAAAGFANLDVGLLAGPLAAVLLLLAAPVTLLGCVSPFAIRLLLHDPRQGGATAGRVTALSTLGSLLGTFIPVLLTIPNLGTRATFYIFSALLLLTAWVGLLLARGRGALPYGLLLLAVLVLAWATSGGVVKADERLVLETESAYNYIQVLRWGPGVQLKLNEGYGVQSVYNPQGDLTGGIWDYFLIAPFFSPAPSDEGQVGSLCLIGLAGGTVSKLYTRAYGSIAIDGVELDPAIIAAGQRYFAMDEPNLNVVAEDGRAFLTGLPAERLYDVIAVDAYRPPYVPFHLSTREFFESCRAHLSERGVVAVNGARVQGDDRLVETLAATMQAVFPSVFIVEEPDEGFATGNSLVVATARPSSLADWQANVAGLRQPLLVEMARRAAPHAREAAVHSGDVVLTDDRAPVEQIVHGIVLRYLMQP